MVQATPIVWPTRIINQISRKGSAISEMTISSGSMGTILGFSGSPLATPGTGQTFPAAPAIPGAVDAASGMRVCRSCSPVLPCSPGAGPAGLAA
ncbi:hypothetical protein GCM10027570_10280 [Streptomonospora sediminis]